MKITQSATACRTNPGDLNAVEIPVSETDTQSDSSCSRFRLPNAVRLSLALFLLLLALPGVTHAQSTTGTTSDGFGWSSSNNQITITGYTGSGGAVIIPSTINNLPVIAIGNSAFQGCTNLTSVTIPGSVTSILNYVFDGCTGLTSVTIGAGVTSIGNGAFYFDPLTSVTIPNSVTSIGTGAFNGSSSLTSAVFLGNAPAMESEAFNPPGVTVYYYNGATGFTSPSWTDSAGDTFASIALADAPVAVNYAAVLTSAAPITIHVLANDSDPAGSPLTITAVTPPSLGQAVISGATIIYTPNMSFASYAGTDSFTYTITDGLGNTATAKVTIGNPFYLQKGNFAGTLGNPGGGYLTLTTAGNGSFTGKLRVGKTSYSLKGSFNSSGAYTATVNGELLVLQMDLSQLTGNAFGSYVITGTYNGVAFDSYHALYNSSTNPAPEVGVYTVLIDPPPQMALTQSTASVTVTGGKITGLSVLHSGAGYISVPAITIAGRTGGGAVATATVSNGQVTGIIISRAGSGYPATGVTATIAPPSGYPQGIGYAIFTVGEAGAVTIAGKLADGTLFSDGALITGGATPYINQFPVYISLGYKSPGSLTGTMTFEDIPGVSDCDGTLSWNKPAQASGVFYQGAFATSLSAIGSRYAAPPAGVLALDLSTASPNASVGLSEQDWTGPLTKAVSVSLGATASSDTVTVSVNGADALKMSINARGGTFGGSFVNPSTLIVTSFSGVLFHKQSMAGGFFLTPTQSGAVSLTSP